MNNRRNSNDENMKTNIYNCRYDDRCKLVNDKSKHGVCPAYYPKPTPFPKFFPECAPFPDFKGERAKYPDFKGERAKYPDFKGERAKYPDFKCERAKYPDFKGEETKYPQYQGEPTAFPQYQGEPTAFPQYQGEPTAFPQYQGEPTTFPQFVGTEVPFYIPKFEEKVIEIPICKPCCDCCNICEQQIKYVLEQLIEKYANDNWVINMEEGNNVSGSPTELTTEKNQGVLKLEESGSSPKTEYVNVCKIASIQITSADYDTTIQYLPDPKEESYCGCADSILAKFNEVVDGETVNINVGGQSTGESTLLENHIGMVVLERGNNVIFVNACKINSFTIKADNP